MNTQTKDMTRGNPAKLILQFALPLMIGNMFQQLYTMVDAMVLGNAIGLSALAAVGAADWPSWMMLGIVTGFTQGFSIPVAQDFGREDYTAVRKDVCMALLLSLILAVVLTALSMGIALPLLKALSTPEEILSGSYTYLMIVFGGILIVSAYNVQASILRALGNSKTPLIAMIVAAAVNIVLDIVFVVFFRWGIAGAAIATVTAQAVSVLICYRTIRRIELLRLQKTDWTFSLPTAKRLLRLGTPTALQNGVIGVGGVVVQNVVNGFGMVFIAGYTATNKLYGLLELAATSFGFSMATYVGQNLGAGQVRRIRKGVRVAAVMGIVTALVIAALMLLFGRQIVGLFISDTQEMAAQAIEVAYSYLKIMSYMLFVLYLLYIYRSSLYGLGDTMVPMISGFAELALRVGMILLLPGILGETGVYLAEVSAWLGAVVILMATYYYRERKLVKSMGPQDTAPAEMI